MYERYVLQLPPTTKDISVPRIRDSLGIYTMVGQARLSNVTNGGVCWVRSKMLAIWAQAPLLSAAFDNMPRSCYSCTFSWSLTRGSFF
eukprot:scaffold85065_cov35-Tisochrysis_lutea.AAC.5